MTGLEESAGAKARVRLPLRERVFEASVVIPTVLALGWASSRVLASLGRSETEDLFIWILLIASVELIPVPLWRGTIISMGFPLLMAVAFLYPPAVAGAAAFLAASDPREFRREVGLLQALFNRSCIALAVWAAGGVFHALVTFEDPWFALVGAALLAAIVDYIVNFGVISIVASLHYRTNPIRVIRELRIGRLSEFVISYLGLAVFGLMLANFFDEASGKEGWWIVPVFVLPLLLARQMFFRSKALEEAHKELQDR